MILEMNVVIIFNFPWVSIIFLSRFCEVRKPVVCHISVLSMFQRMHEKNSMLRCVFGSIVNEFYVYCFFSFWCSFEIKRVHTEIGYENYLPSDVSILTRYPGWKLGFSFIWLHSWPPPIYFSTSFYLFFPDCLDFDTLCYIGAL